MGASYQRWDDPVVFYHAGQVVQLADSLPGDAVWITQDPYRAGEPSPERLVPTSDEQLVLTSDEQLSLSPCTGR